MSALPALSPEHNHLLFSIQRQTRELWIKLMRHALRAAPMAVVADDLDAAFKKARPG